MKLLICGATGRTGRELIKQSLERGHRPTAFVRSPEKLNIQNKNLIIIKGDVRNPIQLAQAASGTDAVLSALGTSGLLPTTLLADFTGAICQAMEKDGVRRLVIISAALLSKGGGLPADIARYVFRYGLADMRRTEEKLARCNLDFLWTIVRPPRLTNGEMTPYSVFEGEIASAAISISRRTLAAFMLDVLERGEYIRKAIGVAGQKTI